MTGPSFAQQHIISLDSAKRAALSHSKTIRNGHLRIDAAKLGVEAAKSDHLPSVSAMGVGLYGFKDFVPAIPSFLNNGINNLYLAAATASTPIYAGGKIRISNSLASLQLQVSKVQMTQSRDSVLLLTEQKYWSLVDLQERQKFLAYNERLLRHLLKQQQDLLASGLIARNDLLKTKVQLNELLVDQSKLENSRRVSLFDLSLHTGIPYDSTLVMQDSLSKETLPGMPALQPDTSLATVAGYQLLVHQLQGEQLQTKMTKAGTLPSISAGLSASEAGVIGKGIGSSFVPAAMATISIPISDGWWGRGSKQIKQRKISEQIAENEIADGANRLRVAVIRSWYDLKDQLSQIEYARVSLEEAAENLKVNTDNYGQGLNSVTDVLDAQNSYQQAQYVLTDAYATFRLRLALYRFTTGKISSE
jgi:outer membrane protein TolC